MHRFKTIRCRVLAGLTAAAGVLGSSASAQQPPAAPPSPPVADVKIDKSTGSLIVPLSGAVRFDPKGGPIVDTFVGKDDVIQARPDPASPAVVILTGRSPGATQLTITYANKDKPRGVYDVIVQPDYDLLRSVIRRTVPTANVEVVAGVGNSIILTGFVTRPEDTDTIIRIASAAVGASTQNIINNIQVGGAQHVLIDVTFAQVDRTELRERGFDFAVGGTEATFRSTVSGLLTSSGLNLSGTGGVGGSTSANIQIGLLPPSVFGALRALKSEGIAKFLSEPKVITQSGRPAFFRAGGQQATIGPAAGITGPGVVLEEVGTELEVLPLVFGNGKIYLEVNPRFRTVNNGRGVTVGGSFTPGFNEQQTRSSILLESGQTYAIGGLLETDQQGSTQKVPWLGDLPWVGSLFSIARYNTRETELLILVTPRLVDALDCNQVPHRMPGQNSRAPDDYELFLEQLLEAPRGQRQVWTASGFVPAYRCHTTGSQFPCVGNVCVGGRTGCSPASGCGAFGGAGIANQVPTTLPAQQLPAAVPQVVPTEAVAPTGFPAAPTTLPADPAPVPGTIPDLAPVPAVPE